MFVLSAIAFNYWLRFHYLNIYSEFQEPPLVKSDAQELHPDVNLPDAPPTFHNYLDDFLQAVRVFGFLEKPVCWYNSSMDSINLGWLRYFMNSQDICRRVD